jgi:hypothetical protein
MTMILLLFLICVGGAVAITVARGTANGIELSTLRILGSVYYGMAALCVGAVLMAIR